MTNPIAHRSIAVLKLPRRTAVLISIARAIVLSMTGNAAFPNPQPTLAAIGTAVADLEVAQTAALSRLKGTAQARNQKRDALVKLLELLRAYVQGVADADPEHAAALIHSAAMNVKKLTLRPRRVFAVRQGKVAGSVTLVTASGGHSASYEWQLSADGGKTWQVLPVTLQAHCAVTGLTPGATYVFRTRTVTRTGEGDWSQPITQTVL